LVTPIQVVRAYGAIANGGQMAQPVLIRKGSQALSAPIQVLKPEWANRLADALTTVTRSGGTGVQAAVEGLSIAGKTGTSQVLDKKTGRYAAGRYLNSFVGFATGIDRKIVVYASLEEPKGGQYAAATAAPLFRAAYSVVAARLSLGSTEPLLAAAPTLNDRIKASLARAEVYTERRLQWVDRDEQGAPVWRMPSTEGLTVREALRSLSEQDFEVEVRGEGPVIRAQTPAPGQLLQAGSRIKLFLGVE
jgi:membrane peptidoglycan carboxypeptidase